MSLNSEDFENELRTALRRADPPADFARRLQKRLPIPIWRRALNNRQAAWGIAAGLFVAAAIPSAVIEYRHREEAKGMEAARQVSYALRLTSAKFRETRERVQRATKQKS